MMTEWMMNLKVSTEQIIRGNTSQSFYCNKLYCTIMMPLQASLVHHSKLSCIDSNKKTEASICNSSLQSSQYSILSLITLVNFSSEWYWWNVIFKQQCIYYLVQLSSADATHFWGWSSCEVISFSIQQMAHSLPIGDLSKGVECELYVFNELWVSWTLKHTTA